MKKEPEDEAKHAEEGEQGQDEEEDPLASMMGFGGFGTTKVCASRHTPSHSTHSQGKGIGQHEEGNVKVHKQRTWRQYMNRRGGFNRPLDKIK